MNPFKELPPVHELASSRKAEELMNTYYIPEILFKHWINEELDLIRAELAVESDLAIRSAREELTERILEKLEYRCGNYEPYKMRHVVNGTGTVLHTNLGRARLSDRAVSQVINAAVNYSNLEYDIQSGKRGSRHTIIQDLLAKASGAEAAMVVNNNAAAVYMILRALAADKEVIVSRGELVEIGGSFRVSTIMEESGAVLTEVGTTNKTHLSDYENAITDETSMIMKVHTSNFKTVGFTAEVPAKNLRDIARNHNLILYEDLGSGSLYPFKEKGVGDEPVVREALNNGADIISFSGDKLLGGPQAGIIAGKKELINKLKKHPLARVLRVDKMTLAALEATLFDYVYDPGNLSGNPAVRDIMKTQDEIRESAVHVIDHLNESLNSVELILHEETSKIGGGTMPLTELPTYGISVEKEGMSASRCERFFREGKIPVICRVKDDKLFIDFRTISGDDINHVTDKIMLLDKTNGEG